LGGKKEKYWTKPFIKLKLLSVDGKGGVPEKRGGRTYCQIVIKERTIGGVERNAGRTHIEYQTEEEKNGGARTVGEENFLRRGQEGKICAKPPSSKKKARAKKERSGIKWLKGVRVPSNLTRVGTTGKGKEDKGR